MNRRDEIEKRRKAFKRLLTIRQINVAELARRTGIPPSTLYSYTGGQTDSMLGVHEAAIAAALSVDTQDLYTNQATSTAAQVGTWHDRLREAKELLGMTEEEIARESGVSKTNIAKYLQGKVENPRGDQRKRIAAALGISHLWLMEGEGEMVLPKKPHLIELPEGLQDHGPVFGMARPAIERVNVPPSEKDLPVYASAEGGNGSIILDTDPIDFVLRPSPLLNVRGAYAFYLVGDSMAPAYEHGDMVLVHPGIPPRGGDDVLLIGQTDDHQLVAMVKRLVRQTREKWHLEQFNPAKEFDADRSKWTIAHRITGKYNRS